MTIHKPLQVFLAQLASGYATPGGGGAAAAAGAMGAALVCMVCNLTIGRKQFADVDDEMRAYLSRSEGLQEKLTQLVSDDAAAYAAVMDAIRLPRTEDAETAKRREAIQGALRQATITSLATARACAEVIELCRSTVELGNPNAASDVAAGAACAHAGLKAAALNVSVNLSSIDDEEFADSCRAVLDEILGRRALADEVYELVHCGVDTTPEKQGQSTRMEEAG